MLDRTVFRPVVGVMLDLEIMSCMRTLTCLVPLQVSFNTNRFLEELGSKDQVRDFVWILPNNHIFFNVRSPSEDSGTSCVRVTCMVFVLFCFVFVFVLFCFFFLSNTI